MNDPLGMMGGIGGPRGPQPPSTASSAKKAADPGAPAFKDVLLQNLDKVNKMNVDADKAVEDIMTGKRTDIETVMAATEKADMAFKLLQSMRNKVQAAYDEIKQVRV